MADKTLTCSNLAVKRLCFLYIMVGVFCGIVIISSLASILVVCGVSLQSQQQRI